MPKPKRRRVSVSLWPWQVKKLDTLAKRFWPSLKPKECRSCVLGALVNYVDARSGYAIRYAKKSGLR